MALTVCSRCGWHDGHGHEEQCWPEAGAACDRLMAFFPQVSSTKLGYGIHCVTFEFSEDRHLTLRVNRKGEFSIDRLFWLGRHDHHNASLFVNFLASAADLVKEALDGETD